LYLTQPPALGLLTRKETIPVDTPGYSHVKLWT